MIDIQGGWISIILYKKILLAKIYEAGYIIWSFHNVSSAEPLIFLSVNRAYIRAANTHHINRPLYEHSSSSHGGKSHPNTAVQSQIHIHTMSEFRSIKILLKEVHPKNKV